jgi:catechol 2,3-dioxygenase-like lactoylglutathione lyase family enzyme
MSIIKFPAKNAASKLASMVGNHVAVRVPDFEQAVKWYVEKLDFRVVHQWPFADEKLAYLAPATDDNFTVDCSLEESRGRFRSPPTPISLTACAMRATTTSA